MRARGYSRPQPDPPPPPSKSMGLRQHFRFDSTSQEAVLQVLRGFLEVAPYRQKAGREMMFNLLRRRGGRWAPIALLLAAHHLTCASMSTYADSTLQLDFERNAIALDASSRSQLAAAVDLARSWCGFEVALVTGHADTSEGNSSRALLELSEARAAYVRQLLLRLGVPEGRAFIDAKGATQPYFPWPRPGGQARPPSWSGRAEVYLKAEGYGGKDRHRDGKDQCRDGWPGR